MPNGLEHNLHDQRTVIARHRKTGRWVTVQEFDDAAEARAYASSMNLRANASHHTFEAIAGDWSAGKAECQRRNSTT